MQEPTVVVETLVQTPKTFSLEIEKIAYDKRCTHLEAVSISVKKINLNQIQ